MTVTLSREEMLGIRRKLAEPELLAPAGNLEKLKFAIHYGADAVYIGGQQYGLRSNADNFSFDQMREGVAFAKKHDAKVFVATNIFPHHDDLPGIKDYLAELDRIGIDAIIVADPSIIETAKIAAPNVELHLSTQQSTLNWQAVKFWKGEGVTRVVLAREVSMQEIQEIKERVDIEIEVFIHGAMCSSFSGRCVLSNHFTDRDSNRGGCCQSCRWKYDLFVSEEEAMMEEHSARLFEEGDNPFTMGSKDLCMIEHIPELIRSGVDSFKIEGRMKSIHYVATVVNAYRQAIDAYMKDPFGYELKQEWLDEIGKAANRPLNTGFFFDEPDHEDHIYTPEEKPQDYDFAGLVLSYDETTGMAVIEQRNHFKPGQEVEFFGPGGIHFKQTVGPIFDEEDQPLDAARHPLQRIRMKVDHPVEKFNIMRKRMS